LLLNFWDRRAVEEITRTEAVKLAAPIQGITSNRNRDIAKKRIFCPYDMKKSSTIFLQVVIVLIGIVALAIMIRFPLTEGRAVNLDLFSIYADPFLIYGYLASMAFFVALYQAFKLLGYIRQNKVFSLNSVKALRTIKYCAIILSVLIVLAAVYIRIFHGKMTIRRVLLP
jgi:hypothetical protein